MLGPMLLREAFYHLALYQVRNVIFDVNVCGLAGESLIKTDRVGVLEPVVNFERITLRRRHPIPVCRSLPSISKQ